MPLSIPALHRLVQASALMTDAGPPESRAAPSASWGLSLPPSPREACTDLPLQRAPHGSLSTTPRLQFIPGTPPGQRPCQLIHECLSRA